MNSMDEDLVRLQAGAKLALALQEARVVQMTSRELAEALYRSLPAAVVAELETAPLSQVERILRREAKENPAVQMLVDRGFGPPPTVPCCAHRMPLTASAECIQCREAATGGRG